MTQPTEKRARIAARPVVRQAVADGAETFQALHKITGLEPNVIHVALRFCTNQARAIRKDGRRYFVAR